MTSIYLVRHCQAQGNVNRVFQGRIDSEISEEGRRQLDRLAERFRRIPLDAVYTSPLQRARLTAEALNRYHGLPVRTDARFIEIDGGCWEGHSWEEFPHTDPQQCDDWLNAPWRFQTRGGEAMACVYARMAEGLTAVAAAHPGRGGGGGFPRLRHPQRPVLGAWLAHRTAGRGPLGGQYRRGPAGVGGRQAPDCL